MKIDVPWIRVSKVGLDQRNSKSVNLEEELDKYAVCFQFCLTYRASTLPRKLFKGLEALK
jgi:hypothetical protein